MTRLRDAIENLHVICGACGREANWDNAEVAEIHESRDPSFPGPMFSEFSYRVVYTCECGINEFDTTLTSSQAFDLTGMKQTGAESSPEREAISADEVLDLRLDLEKWEGDLLSWLEQK